MDKPFKMQRAYGIFLKLPNDETMKRFGFEIDQEATDKNLKENRKIKGIMCLVVAIGLGMEAIVFSQMAVSPIVLVFGNLAIFGFGAYKWLEVTINPPIVWVLKQGDKTTQLIESWESIRDD